MQLSVKVKNDLAKFLYYYNCYSNTLSINKNTAIIMAIDNKE